MSGKFQAIVLLIVAIHASDLWANDAGKEADPSGPLVCVGISGDQTPMKLHGNITQRDDGTFNLPAGAPWGWIAVGPNERPMRQLEELQSFTICGWARPISLDVGSGGNRIAFNLDYNRAGFDLVHHRDGRLRLAVNEWPDRVGNDSSSGKLEVGKWTFFAVTYDGTKSSDNVHWYFGDPKTAAALDRTTSYDAGPTGAGSGVLTIGNYNPTIHRHGTDRQFRGQLHAIRVFGSRTGSDGALSLQSIREFKANAKASPDFTADVPADLVRTATTTQSSGGSNEAVVGVSVSQPAPGTFPRIIATTDGEIDDRCSMVRFLLYANEWDIEGIIHCSSKFHWKGDGRDVKQHNWADEVWLDEQINLYEEAYPNLSQHDEGFPTADALRKLVYTGNVVNVGDMIQDTPGSDRIVEVLLDDEPGLVYLQVWGGTNTIARALWKIQHQHPDQMEKVSNKAIIYIILDQDKTFRDYIQPNWPKLQVLGSFRQFACIAYRWDRIIPEPQKRFFEKSWMEEHILKKHGRLCAIYESRDGAFRSEGDSPSFMHQIDVGLRSLDHPGWGGWGGRFVQESSGSSVWRGAKDDGNLDQPIWRWAEAFQNDWAARADWCVTRKYADANHPPVVKAAALNITARPGETVTLDASESSDPDSDKLTHKWWQYGEVDTHPGSVEIADAGQAKTTAVIPQHAKDGETIHIIAEVTDEGSPRLTRYARVVVSVEQE
ncbi:MAG: DUF1593 domain-containing protein [Planctomycetes bacterium]|nr:DUF1593 domain-containing protein [Planctomycetota bacterium]